MFMCVILIFNLDLRYQRVMIVQESLISFFIFVFPWVWLHNSHVSLKLLRALLSTASFPCQLLLPNRPCWTCTFGVFIPIYNFFVNLTLALSSMVFNRRGPTGLKSACVASNSSIVLWYRLDSLILVNLALTRWAIFQTMPINLIVMLVM